MGVRAAVYVDEYLEQVCSCEGQMQVKKWHKPPVGVFKP